MHLLLPPLLPRGDVELNQVLVLIGITLKYET